MPWRVLIAGLAFAAVIVFIPCSADGCKPCGEDGEWLPRRCPSCGQQTVIGHGRRWRRADDRIHSAIRVRRGLCRHCERTLTVLPRWCVPRARYSLAAREDALERLVEGGSLEQAVPLCRDADRLPDTATVRRWAWRRLESFALWMAGKERLFETPTLFAWDWKAALAILMAGAVPP